MKLNILVVDSSILNARTVAAMYEAFGCQVALACDVAQALAAIAHDPFDVVIVSHAFSRGH